MTHPFRFSADTQAQVEEVLSKYPLARKASALIPLLDLAQREMGGWLSKEAIQVVAAIVDVPFIKAYEVATFYSMFNLQPVGKYHIKVCGTTPCWLRGAEDIMNTCKSHLNVNVNETTQDGTFTLTEFECLGACVNAPVVQINDDYIEDVTPQALTTLLDNLAKGEPLKPHSCQHRQASKALKE